MYFRIIVLIFVLCLGHSEKLLVLGQTL